jgi:hypothetical protein
MPLGQNRAGQLGGLDGTAYAQWATTKDFHDYWGSPAWDVLQPETYGVADCGGEQWLTLTRLGPHKIKTLKAIVTRNGVAKEIACEHGHPYALLEFVPHKIQLWGDVGGMLFYWEATYSLATLRNPLLGPRECIVQRECWGNPYKGGPSDGPWEWVRGGPTPADAIPFRGSEPIGITCDYAWFQGIGKGYGPTYVMGDTNNGVDVVTSCANSNGWAW